MTIFENLMFNISINIQTSVLVPQKPSDWNLLNKMASCHQPSSSSSLEEDAWANLGQEVDQVQQWCQKTKKMMKKAEKKMRADKEKANELAQDNKKLAQDNKKLSEEALQALYKDKCHGSHLLNILMIQFLNVLIFIL